MHKINFEILGKPWILRVLKRKRYTKKNGYDSVAITYRDKRRIDVSRDGADLETVVHELVHAYMTELCTYSAELDDDQIEEIFAELLAKRGRELLDLADTIYAEIQTLTAAKVHAQCL